MGAQLPGVRSIDFENAFYADEGTWIESLLLSTSEQFDPETALLDLSRVELYHSQQVSDSQSDRTSYRLVVIANEPYPFLLGVILRAEAIPNRLVLRHGQFNAVVTVEEWEGFRSLADRIQERFGRFELHSVSEVDTTGEPLGSGQLSRVLQNELTQEQLNVLEMAHEMGYFDVPREASADDIATELDIAQSTLSERLRIAEKQLLDLVFASGEFADALEDA
ncbi:helix-turn-helix domain-containing protein [halophilic archaeon]|nr:helix-turn-helix domain-containing protein [halophilic archaeon]